MAESDADYSSAPSSDLSEPTNLIGLQLVDLPVSVPLYFVEACGYRGSARYVALRWNESSGDLWLTDDGHTLRANGGPVPLLWRRPGGEAALERVRAAQRELGRSPWLVVDRARNVLLVGCALSVWELIAVNKPRHGRDIIQSG